MNARIAHPTRLADGRELPAGSVGEVIGSGEGYDGVADVLVRFPLAGGPVELLVPEDELSPVDLDRGSGPNAYPTVLRDASGRPVDVG